MHVTMKKEELKAILDAENNKADEMATEWSLISYAAAQRAMVATYNKALEDAIGLSRFSDETDLEGHLISVVDVYDLERLKIKD